MEHKRFSGLWNYSVWYCNSGYMTLCMCQNPDHTESDFNINYAYMRAKLLHCVWLFATLWTAACQAPLSMWFSRQEYWSGVPFPSPGDHPDAGIKSVFLMSPAPAGVFFTTSRSLYTDRYLNLAIICPNFHSQDNFFPFKETMYFYIYLSPRYINCKLNPQRQRHQMSVTSEFWVLPVCVYHLSTINVLSFDRKGNWYSCDFIKPQKNWREAGIFVCLILF